MITSIRTGSTTYIPVKQISEAHYITVKTPLIQVVSKYLEDLRKKQIEEVKRIYER